MTKDRAAKIILDLINAGEAEYISFSDEEIIAFKKAYVALNPEPITNADRIRSMSDEELVDIFANNDCGYCRIHNFCFAKGCAINCEDVWLEWLKQEAKP